MMFSGWVVQFLNGLADASSLFLVALGLSLIFGVTRVVNFAHGSLYMLGIFLATSLVQWLAPGTAWGFWLSIVLAALATAALGAILELLVLRRIYPAPELFQLLATFALVLIIGDVALWAWGPEDILGPLAPGLDGAVRIGSYYLPTYDIFLMVLGPLVLLLVWRLVARTYWGALLRAATQDRSMLAALGVNQAWLFTAVFALGAGLAGLGGALQLPRQPASLQLDLGVIADAFVVVVVGGMGSLPGAYVAALLISQIKALCIALGTVSLFGIALDFTRLTLAAEFMLMAVVLVFRPWGLFGRVPATQRAQAHEAAVLRPAGRRTRTGFVLLLAALAALPLVSTAWPYVLVLMLDVMLAALFALSLHFMMAPGGMMSFGHAAYYGLGAYGAALLAKTVGLPMVPAFALGVVVAGAGAALFGWFCVRLSGVYLAMLTLAFAQIVWSLAYQWDGLTGGSNGIIGVWPDQALSGTRYYYFALALVAVSAWLLRRLVFSSFGLAMRASRDSPLRAQALGMDVRRIQWLAFIISGLFAGLAGSLFVFAKGGVSPEALSIARSVDALVMVLLGGLHSLAGPLLGAGAFQVLQDGFAGITEYWHAAFGAIILVLVLAFPAGLAGAFSRRRAGGGEAAA
ncbi:MAG: ABC transporter permease [Castellaniella sp.]